MAEQRTEKPTPRKIKKFRDEGRFLISPSLPAVIQIGSAGAALYVLRDSVWHLFQAFLARSLSQISSPSSAFMTTLLQSQDLVALLARIALTGLVLGWASHLAMTGGGFTFASITSQLGGRVNPFARITNLVQGAPTKALSSLAMMILFLATFLLLLWMQREELAMLSLLPLDTGLAKALDLFRSLITQGLVLIVLIASLELARDFRKFQGQLKMTKQEVRQEAQDAEGRPEVKSQLRRFRRELLRRRMMSRVETATVIVTNPTHYAVGLKYELGQSGAPQVVAKGKNYLAKRIRERAFDHGVPIIENAPLARALYRSTEVGQEIPPALYRAVAELLAYIHRIAQRF